MCAQGINGNKMEKACDLVHITLNKNAVVGDVSALAPGGVRIGAPAMTSRGLQESHFETIADFLDEVSVGPNWGPVSGPREVHAHCNACVLHSSDVLDTRLLKFTTLTMSVHAMKWPSLERSSLADRFGESVC